MHIQLRGGRRKAPGTGAGPHPARREPRALSARSFAGTSGGSAGPDARGAFRYFFPGAPAPEHDESTVAALDALADSMAEPADPGRSDSGIPPVFTYLGRFIDHDIAADPVHGRRALDEDGASSPAGEMPPLPRDTVVRDRRNLRSGCLALDSIYGGGQPGGAIARRLTAALRHPEQRSKMWLGTLADAGLGRVPFPPDPEGDLLRLGRLLREPHKQFDLAELLALPEPARAEFVDAAGRIRVQRPVIGDARNGDNLVVSQLHLAFLRFHNRVVDAAPGAAGPVHDADALHEWAKRQVRWIYQWLVLNVFLKTMCDPAVVRDVMARRAPLYADLLRRQVSDRPVFMPMPLEFSAAAFRLGDTMMRSGYDWNRFFGRPSGTAPPLRDRACLAQLLALPDDPRGPLTGPDGVRLESLPGHWVPEWERLTGGVAGHADRGARKIDTQVAPPVTADGAGADLPRGFFRAAARRNLRRGHRLSLPSAQDCIAGLYARTGTAVEPLGADELTSGRTGNAIRDGRFVSRTPLWFYVLKEAECRAEGERLGPLGSRLVAETLTGLVVHDPGSYWHQLGSDGGRWHPRDGVQPGGEVVDSLPALLRAAGVL